MPGDPRKSIVDKVKEYWLNYGKPILFANLGSLISATDKGEAVAKSGSLSKFIANELLDELRPLELVAHGGGAAPREGTSHLSDRELEAMVPLPRRLEHSGVAPTRPAPYFDSVWTAFSEPLKATRRFLVIQNDGAKLVEDDVAPEEIAAIEITADDLPEGLGATPQTPQEIARAIRNWAMHHSISLGKLRPEQRIVMPSEAKSHVEGGGSRSRESLRALQAFLVTLSPAELQGVSISSTTLLSLLQR